LVALEGVKVSICDLSHKREIFLERIKHAFEVLGLGSWPTDEGSLIALQVLHLIHGLASFICTADVHADELRNFLVLLIPWKII
jgi:hypothetical protein